MVVEPDTYKPDTHRELLETLSRHFTADFLEDALLSPYPTCSIKSLGSKDILKDVVESTLEYLGRSAVVNRKLPGKHGTEVEVDFWSEKPIGDYSRYTSHVRAGITLLM